ncbi:pyruvate kinase [Candidatus Peregrinibacteria bacterium]|nr:pyruvate kinase [Candidatus Peregrinibacteria bacterium]
MHIKNTKVVCTLGPASNSVTEITKLVQAGMNVARLNFSHGDYKSHQELIKNIHIVEKNTGKRIGILQDLQGPKIRLGDLPAEGVILKKGDTFILTSNKSAPSSHLPIQFKPFTSGLKKNDMILFNDGLVENEVLQIIDKENVKCLVKCGGLVRAHAGVHLPGITQNIETITAKDKQDLVFGLKNNVDYVALSFVKSAQDIKNLRKLIQKQKKSTKIIAKIELKLAVNNLEEIIKTVDGAMVARGDLGIDIPAEQVPIVQKRIIALCNKYAKPVITATEVLLSMVTNPRATRAEISDAANAVYDRTDAIMLSNESAVGKFPSQATATLSRVAGTVEKELRKYSELENNFFIHSREVANPHCSNACDLAEETDADYLVIYTSDGYTARELSRHRPHTPIITICEHEETARELTLVWGLNNIFAQVLKKENKIEQIVQILKKNKIVKKGNKVVILANSSKKEKIISNITI